VRVERRWLEDWDDWLRREDLLPGTPFLISPTLSNSGHSATPIRTATNTALKAHIDRHTPSPLEPRARY
jgi:hypothetical protein